MGRDDCAARHEPAVQSQRHRLRRHGKPSHGVKESKGEAYDLEQHTWCARCRGDKAAPRPGASSQTDQPDRQQQAIEPDEEAGRLPKHIEDVPAMTEPPAASHPPFIGMSRHVQPRGKTSALSQSMEAVILVCWIAAAGSTSFGQTSEHAPTNVHSQIPSLLATISARSVSAVVVGIEIVAMRQRQRRRTDEVRVQAGLRTGGSSTADS